MPSEKPTRSRSSSTSSNPEEFHTPEKKSPVLYKIDETNTTDTTYYISQQICCDVTPGFRPRSSTINHEIIDDVLSGNGRDRSMSLQHTPTIWTRRNSTCCITKTRNQDIYLDVLELINNSSKLWEEIGRENQETIEKYVQKNNIKMENGIGDWWNNLDVSTRKEIFSKTINSNFTEKQTPHDSPIQNFY